MEEHSLHHDHELEEHPPWWKGPIKLIIAIFLILIITMWGFSYYAVKLDPEPKTIPTIEEVLPENSAIETKSFNGDFSKFVTPTDPAIKQIATKISTLSCDGNKVCQAKALYYFVRDNIEYVADPVNNEYVESGVELMDSGGGDCESGSLLLASLTEAIGIDAQLVLITGHAYLRINLPEAVKGYKLDEDWVYLDWTCKNCKFGEIPWKNIKKQASYLEVP